MLESRHWLAPVVLAIAVAPGCIQPRPLPFGAGSEPPPPDAATPDAATGEVGGDGGRAPRPSPCASDLPPRVALVTVRGPEIVFVMSDGSIRSVYRFDPYPPASGTSFSANVVARDGNVVATATWWGAPDQCDLQAGLLNCPETNRSVLLDLDGRVRWEKQRTGRTSSASIGLTAQVGERGWSVLSDAFGGVLVAPDGTETELPAEARGRPFSGPAVPASLFVAETAKTLFAWWRPDRPLAATEPPIEIGYGNAAFDAGDELDFVGLAPDGARVIAHARPDSTVILPDPVEPGAVDTSSGSWRAIDDGATVVRFDLVTGQTDHLTWTFPAGMRPLGPTAVGHDGSFARVFRDDNVAAAFVSRDGASWSPIGRTLWKVETASVQELGGTYLVSAKGTSEFFVPTQQWADGPDGQTPELVGASVQVVRPADGVAAVIALAWYPIKVSRDGLCAAYWETAPSGARLVLHDLARDLRTPTLETRAAWPPALVFID